MLKIILWHVGYIAVVILYMWLVDQIPAHIDDFNKLPRFVQFLTKLVSFVSIAFVFGFCVMNCLLCTESREEFLHRFTFQAIGATYVSIMILCFRFREKSKRKIAPMMWIIPVLFFVYSLVKNIIVTDGFFPFVFREILSLVVVFGGFFLPYNMDESCKPYYFDKEEARKAGEAIAAKREEEEKRRRAESVSRSRRYSAGDYSDDEERKGGFFDSFAEGNINSRTMHNISGQGYSRTCANCRYYDGGGCNNPNSFSYQTTIWNASDHNCGQHSY